MKIGILTQPLLRNYGGVLQNYALQTVLRRLGHEPVTVDYQHPMRHYVVIYMLSVCKTTLLRMIGRGRNRKFHRFPPLRRTGDFNHFVQRHIATTKLVSAYRPSLICDYRLDALVVGSDQVWRPMYNCRNLYSMFLDFAQHRPVKRVAYAASFGVDTWEFDPEQTAMCRRLASQFDAISVREPSGVGLCREHLGVEASSVVDPTLLLGKDDYLRLCSDIEPGGFAKRQGQTAGCRYCLAFVLDMTDEKMDFIQGQAKRRGIDNVFVVQDGDRISISIEMWLAAIRDAALVVTDSFHGTVFALLFGCDFITIGNSARGLERMTTLLEMVGLTERLVTTDRLATFDGSLLTPIESRLVVDKLAAMQQASTDFLVGSLVEPTLRLIPVDDAYTGSRVPLPCRPKVSVIIAVYKVERYIERCCRSLFGQTIDSIEYIFVNDCTPDGSIEVMQRVLGDYPNRRGQVRVINHKVNQGVAAARQHGTDAAQGEYIIHCDPDDWVELDMYETMYNTAKREGVQLVICDFDNVRPNGEMQREHCRPEQLTGISLMTGISGAAFHRLHGSLWNKLIASTCYTSATRFPEGVSYCEDVCLLFLLLPTIGQIAYVDKAMYHYDISIGGSLVKSRDMAGLIRLIRWIEHFICASDRTDLNRLGKAQIAQQILGISLSPLGISSKEFRYYFSKYRKYQRFMKAPLCPHLLRKYSFTVDYKTAYYSYCLLRKVWHMLKSQRNKMGGC